MSSAAATLDVRRILHLIPDYMGINPTPMPLGSPSSYSMASSPYSVHAIKYYSNVYAVRSDVLSHIMSVFHHAVARLGCHGILESQTEEIQARGGCHYPALVDRMSISIECRLVLGQLPFRLD